MKKTMIKRTLSVIFVIALVIAVYSSSAYCVSPSPSPSATVSPSPSPSPSGTVSPSPTPGGSDQSTGSEAPTQTTSAFPLKNGSTGSMVVRVQMRLRDLGYLNYRPTGKYFAMSESAVRDFQETNDLDADGRIGEASYQKLFSISGVERKPVSPSVVPKSGPKLEGSPQSYGELGDWAVINTEFTVGMTVKITDFNKRDISFNVIRAGGTNLATVEVSTAADYTKFLQCFGDNPSWEKRSVLVTVGSKTYAASLFGNPAGEDTIPSNTMEGHTTLYFFGSATDVSGFIDKEDVRMVMRAAGKSVDDNNRSIYDYCPGKYQ